MGFGVKITPADKWFSRCTRERADWTCERCGTRYTPPTTALECSHWEGRANWGTRFEPLNALALCSGCHSRMGSFRFEHDKLHASIHGEFSQEIIKEKAQNIPLYKAMKQTKGKGLISAHFKAEYERMMNERAAGVVGRLEFIGYE
jgi:hypothetical protein